MARRASRQRFGISLGSWIFLIIALLVLLIAGGAVVATQVLGDRFARQSAAKALDSSQAVRTVLQQQRYRQLQLVSRIFATDRLLTSYLAEAAEARDPVSILDTLEEYQNLLSFDLAVVLDQEGVVLCRTDDPQAFGEDMTNDPIVSVALEDKQAFGVWPEGEGLFHAAALPLVRSFEQVGYIVVAFSINDALARQIQRISGAEVVFLTNSATGPAVAASTLAPATAAELISSLRLKGEVLNRVTQKGETADQVDVALEGQDWIGFLAPLKDAADVPVGAAVTLTSFEERLAEHRLLQLLLLGLGAVALIAGLLFSQLLSRRTSRPLSVLATAAGRAERGDFGAPLPSGGSGDVGRLRDSLGDLFAELGGREALEHFVTRVRRYLPEPAKGSALTRPQARQTALLGIELRRFANPKIGYDPEDNLGRMARDLQRVSAAASSHRGRLEAVFGHRALAVFEGEGAAFQALCAATETLHVLSARENVFDEAEPPVVALACGSVILGSVIWGDRPSSAVAGLPIQQLESLMREATPGEIYFSKPVGQELAELLRSSGIRVRAQRGLLSPQPLYVLSGEQASQLTGIAPATTDSDFPDERKSLSDIRPGVLLGNRYDVTAELGAGRLGPIFKAQDRELGDLVTLKMLKPEVTADAARFDRLKAVIRDARMLRHPNVLSVLDFAETDGLPYVSVELVRALTLRYLLEQGGRMGVAAALHLARQIGWALAAAHQEKLLHLGLKPENVLVEPGGHTRVMDFGQAAAIGAGIPVSGAAYLAPEQLEGSGGDARTDVFAWGAVLYETLAGQVPYPGSTPEEVRQQHLMQDAAPVSTLAEEVPPQLDQIVARCLAKAPDARYGSVQEVLGDLATLRVET